MTALFRRFFPTSADDATRRTINGNDNVIVSDGAVLNGVVIEITGNHNRIHIGKNARLNQVKIYMRGDHHTLTIGEECQFRRGSSLWFEDRHGTLSIGEKSTFEDVHVAVTEPHSNVTVGRDCMLAYDIDIRTGDSHSILCAQSGKRINYAKDIVIGDHVWIAAHSVILKGVTLPENCVVATGAVVAKGADAPGTILGGNPAVPIKEQVTWDRRRINDR